MSTPASPNNAAPVLTAEQAQRTSTTNLPSVDHHGETVEAVGPDTIRVRLPFKPEYLGREPRGDASGRVFSGPMVMGFAGHGDVLLRHGCNGQRRHSGDGQF